MNCPMVVFFYEADECEKCEGHGRIRVLPEHAGTAEMRKCPDCDGRGEHERSVEEHSDNCEVCGGSGNLPEHVRAWIAAEQIPAIREDDQRAIIALHNRGMLVRPPVSSEYGLVELCVAATDDLNALLASVDLKPCGIVNLQVDENGKASMGHWVLLSVVPPSLRDIAKFAREWRSHHAAA